MVRDINHDGYIDVMKNTWTQEPWFVPGTYSGKVIVRIFNGTQNGTIPEKPSQVFRKNDWTSSIPEVDIDGDEYLDLAFGYHRWKGRQDVIKSLSAKKVEYYLRFFFSRRGKYNSKPDCQKSITLVMDERRPGMDFSWGSNVFDKLVNLEGDFNGDGKKDILAREDGSKWSVYFFKSRKEGFNKKSDMRINIKDAVQVMVRDLNNDGLSDIIGFSDDPDSYLTSGDTKARILISHKKD
jgi:hypothetical protein